VPKTENILFALLIAIVIPLELVSAWLAFETLGQIMSTIYYFLITLNLLFILLAFRYRALAALAIVSLALLIIPYQLFLGNRLLQIQAEAASIVSYAYEEQIANGKFPADLSEYEFRNDDIEPYIQKYQPDEGQGGFTLFYRVGTESTSHYYSPAGGWGYYPD
jgi:hypothetical protein